jgi:hypothetical protein
LLGLLESTGAGVDPVQQEVEVVANSLEEVVGEDSSQANSMDTTELEMALKEWGEDEESSKLPTTEDLAVIPEATPELASVRRSKRQTGDVDEEVGAIRNEGMLVDCLSSSHINSSVVVSNLNAIGICLGDDDVSIEKSVCCIKEKAMGSMQERAPISLKESIREGGE